MHRSGKSGNEYGQHDSHLKDYEICMLLSQFLQNWRNHFAWAAPSGEEINDHQFVTSIFDLLIEVGL